MLKQAATLKYAAQYPKRIAQVQRKGFYVEQLLKSFSVIASEFAGGYAVYVVNIWISLGYIGQRITLLDDIANVERWL